MNFDFPDVADFPENMAQKFPEHIKMDHLFIDQYQFKSDTRELATIITKTMGLNEDHQRILRKQINRIVGAARSYYGYKAAKRRDDLRGGIAYEKLMEYGVHAVKIDTSELVGMFEKRARDLEKRKRAVGLTDYDRAQIDNSPATLKAIHRLLDSHGLLEAGTRYRGGNDLSVRSATLHVAKPGDRHHYQQFRDCEASTKLLNLHFDPKPGIMKAIIYLGEVKANDGPFCFIKGSHMWQYGEMERIFAWGNSVGNYCHTPDHRIVANAFPKRLRGNAIVGRLIQDDTRLSKQLRRMLHPYLSAEANVMMFDPTFGLHQGGNPTSGMRVNLQVVMK
jgi:hypothetical protein